MRTYHLTHTDSDGKKTPFVIEANNLAKALHIYRQKIKDLGLE